MLINHSWFAFIFTSSNPTPHIEQQVLSGNYPIGLIMLNYTLCTVQQPACTCGSGQFWHWVWISVSISQSISNGKQLCPNFWQHLFYKFVGLLSKCSTNRGWKYVPQEQTWSVYESFMVWGLDKKSDTRNCEFSLNTKNGIEKHGIHFPNYNKISIR